MRLELCCVPKPHKHALPDELMMQLWKLMLANMLL